MNVPKCEKCGRSLDKDLTIDLLHAIAHQLDGREVTLDGESYFIEEICESAISLLSYSSIKEVVEYDIVEKEPDPAVKERRKKLVAIFIKNNKN